MLPTTLEWHVAAGLVVVAGLAAPWTAVPAFATVGVLLLLSVVVAGLQATQAKLPAAHDRPRARLLVMALCYLQPLVRSWARYRTRLFAYRTPRLPTGTRPAAPDKRLPLSGRRALAYWNEGGLGRLQLLGCVVQYFTENRWGRSIDSGWSEWDVEVYCHPWTVVQIFTAEEDHGENKRLVRVRYRLRPSGYLTGLAAAAVLGGAVAAGLWPWAAAAWAGSLLAACGGLWWRGTRRAALAVAVVHRWAAELGMVRVPEPGDDQGRVPRASRPCPGHEHERDARGTSDPSPLPAAEEFVR
jgi:hypothetical protein